MPNLQTLMSLEIDDIEQADKDQQKKVDELNAMMDHVSELTKQWT